MTMPEPQPRRTEVVHTRQTEPGMLSKRYFGLPGVVWLGIVVLAAGGWFVYQRFKTNQTAANAPTTDQTTTGNSATDAGLATDQYETILATLRDIQQTGPQTGPPGSAGPPGPPGPPGTGGGSVGGKPTYTYVTVTKFGTPHGTLWGIAQDVYGNGALYMKIYDANKKGITRADGTPGFLTNPNQIKPEQRLVVPNK